MQKITNGPGRSRKLWPNVRYADTLTISELKLFNEIINSLILGHLKLDFLHFSVCMEIYISPLIF